MISSARLEMLWRDTKLRPVKASPLKSGLRWSGYSTSSTSGENGIAYLALTKLARNAGSRKRSLVTMPRSSCITKASPVQRGRSSRQILRMLTESHSIVRNVLLHIGANAREDKLHLHAERLEYAAVSDTAQLENLRRLDRSAPR